MSHKAALQPIFPMRCGETPCFTSPRQTVHFPEGSLLGEGEGTATDGLGKPRGASPARTRGCASPQYPEEAIPVSAGAFLAGF